ncbi:hypothetical protein BEL04_04040 [Mucilaginibacter sp. PPCGB 2223]|uniref:hypothetical protein n=1 Tax=Mucilaginibacter sp. PPCGB 2223 TaxID=1886027 RepID=UPI0008263EA4|nr:hypothetical protein [Mucilaginibacter sp. PPCGB 2223]OCX53480.1 hypothetical protein BEL04_04040 [Mucilaginibacter sp. PPCGB 2223]
MKKLVLTFIAMAAFIKCFAINTDSLLYEHQRAKINGMLDVRRQKFSQYTESLDMHTGIFGLQTKKDIRRSNEILMEIVRTDDNIFKELKILLEYKTFEQTQVASKSEETENHALAYMATINKLRDENTRLQSEENRVTNEFRQRQTMHIVVILLLILLSVFLLTRKRPTANTN